MSELYLFIWPKLKLSDDDNQIAIAIAPNLKEAKMMTENRYAKRNDSVKEWGDHHVVPADKAISFSIS